MKKSFVSVIFVGLLLSSLVLTTVVSASPATVALNPQPVPPAPLAKILSDLNTRIMGSDLPGPLKMVWGMVFGLIMPIPAPSPDT